MYNLQHLKIWTQPNYKSSLSFLPQTPGWCLPLPLLDLFLSNPSSHPLRPWHFPLKYEIWIPRLHPSFPLPGSHDCLPPPQPNPSLVSGQTKGTYRFTLTYPCFRSSLIRVITFNFYLFQISLPFQHKKVPPFFFDIFTHPRCWFGFIF